MPTTPKTPIRRNVKFPFAKLDVILCEEAVLAGCARERTNSDIIICSLPPRNLVLNYSFLYLIIEPAQSKLFNVEIRGREVKNRRRRNPLAQRIRIATEAAIAKFERKFTKL